MIEYINVFALDPPSGVWKGVYSLFGKDQLIEVGLNFKAGTIDGTGVDNIFDNIIDNIFDVSGEWSHLNLEGEFKVSFEKNHRNNSFSIPPTFYSGVITEENGIPSMIGFYSEKREGAQNHEKYDFDLKFEGTFNEILNDDLKYLLKIS